MYNHTNHFSRISDSTRLDSTREISDSTLENTVCCALNMMVNLCTKVKVAGQRWNSRGKSEVRGKSDVQSEVCKKPVNCTLNIFVHYINNVRFTLFSAWYFNIFVHYTNNVRFTLFSALYFNINVHYTKNITPTTWGLHFFQHDTFQQGTLIYLCITPTMWGLPFFSTVL